MAIDLTKVLATPQLSRKEKLLAILVYGNKQGMQPKEIRKIGIQHGLPEIAKWNLSSMLSRMSGLVVRLPGGWTSTDDGKELLDKLGVVENTPAVALQPTLREYVEKIQSPQVQQFLDEAVSALEGNLLRSAVVLSWIGAVAILYEVILNKHLTAFNVETKKRYPKWKNAQTIDDLSRLKEFDFLQVLCAISVIGKNTKEELEQCLKLRNACGHPNTHSVGEHRVASHLEVLILNVYSKFVI